MANVINAVGNNLSDVTGSGKFVGDTSPVLVTPSLGTPSDINLTNATNLPNSATSATANNTASTIVLRDSDNNFAAGVITASLSGNATTATTLATSRSIYGNDFNGAADVDGIIAAEFGGLGAASLNAHGIIVAEGTSAAVAKVLTDGQVLIGVTNSDPAAATLTAGTGIDITSVAGSITVSATSTPPINVTTATQQLAVNQSYIINTASGLTTLTLPATASVGSVVRIKGNATGGWLIAQNAGQTIHSPSGSTATGVTGSVASTSQYDCVELTCVVADTDFVVNSVVGSLSRV